jgi:hypothetical protein
MLGSFATLLEAVTEELAIQGKHEKLAEARGLLAQQRVDEAVEVVAALAKQLPQDSAVQKLSALVLQEKINCFGNRTSRIDLPLCNHS